MELHEIYRLARAIPDFDQFKAKIDNLITGQPQSVQSTNEFKLLVKPIVSGSVYRYPMTYDQPCQIDCRVTNCKFYKGAGKCENVSPAITLNENGKFVCWSKSAKKTSKNEKLI